MLFVHPLLVASGWKNALPLLKTGFELVGGNGNAENRS
jgi:hypothetical protein